MFFFQTGMMAAAGFYRTFLLALLAVLVNGQTENGYSKYH